MLKGTDIPPIEALRLWNRGRVLGKAEKFWPPPTPTYDAAKLLGGPLLHFESEGREPRTPNVAQVGDAIIAGMLSEDGAHDRVVIGREVNGKFVENPELAPTPPTA
jgi:hypothetical protein